ncbi:MAG TPA: isoprenylcysteine carboxylmethyltransferase family protein [Beijerinckiaceae bacterium]|nr:isoprenylcysteine carboxylmethyltransferase family protein [Beijerinckiaceae bacterium]
MTYVFTSTPERGSEAPQSVHANAAAPVSLAISLCGLAAAALTLAFCRQSGALRIEAALLVCMAYAGTVLAGETLLLRTPWAASAGLDFARRGFDLARIGTKLLGLYGVFAVLACIYWLFPEYRAGMYQPTWVAAQQLLPYVLILAVPYVACVDRAMKAPEDGLYWFGRLLLLDRDPARWPALRQFALGWIVKGFFTPIMFHGLVQNTETLMRSSFDLGSLTFAQFYALATVCLFWTDVMVACVGYVFALRLFDTHIRSSEPTAFGWFICLMCYPPFQTVLMAQYFAFSAQNAVRLLSDWPLLQMVWGVAALALLVIYTLSTLVFGCRFSNITHRGVIAAGPYRFTKHPAYVTKNLYWWLAHAPFIPVAGAGEALRFCILMVGINVIYYLRSKTEERHLSHDPAYVAYATAMNDKSLFAPVARILPFLRYRSPECGTAHDGPYKGLA